MALWAQIAGLTPQISPQGGLGSAGGTGSGAGGAGSPVAPGLPDRIGPMLTGFLCSPGCDDCNCNNPFCHCDGPLPPGYGFHGCLDGYCCC